MTRRRVRLLVAAMLASVALLGGAPAASADSFCVSAEVLGVGGGACAPAP